MRIVSSSCSTTMTVLPRSRSRASVAEQLAVVALVQADRRLVEHVEHAGEVRADLRRQPDALPFAARQRRRAAAERQVADADVVEEPQPILDLAQDALGDDRLAIGQLAARRTRRAPRRSAGRRTRRSSGPSPCTARLCGFSRCAAGTSGTAAATGTARAPPAPPTCPLRSGGAGSA